MPKQYSINKGVNRAIEFRGLKAQYIGYLAAAVLGVLFLFAVLYLVGVSAYVLVPLSLGLGGILVSRVYGMSRKYGQYGLMKRRARRGVPEALRSRSRKCFVDLYGDSAARRRST
jgi:hypothetical protein